MTNINNDEIHLKAFFLTIWRNKLLISFIVFITATISIIYALSLQNIYISKSLLLPSDTEQTMSQKIGGYSALAGIAGVSLDNENASKSQEAIERIKSYEFFSKHFLPNIKLEDIMAVKKWVKRDNTIIYYENQYDSKNNTWVRSPRFYSQITPSNQEAYEVYKEILTIAENKKTAFINISITHKSPVIAQEWVTLIIEQINESMRKVDQEQAQISIEFLNELSRTTKIQSIKEVISNLLENQMQTLMLTSSNEAYIFKIIDYPIIPEKKSGPQRAFIVILGAILGFIISLIYIFVNILRNNR